MWSRFIVVNPPPLDESFGLAQALGPVRVQTLIAELAVEALDESVVHRPAWRDEVEFDSAPVRPLIEVVTGELGSVVHTEQAVTGRVTFLWTDE